MATVNGMTAEAMLAIRDGVVVSGAVNPSGNLILTKYNGATIDAGPVTASALMTIQDTPTIDLNLAGLGTPASPWVLSASLKPPIEIGANVDLNSLMSSGTYFQSESSEATLLLNYPTPERGLLEIFDNGAQQVVQRYTVTGDSEAAAKDFNGGEVYIRVHHWWAGWRGWHKLGHRSQELVSETNLNNVRLAGTYMQLDNAEATTALNYPTAVGGFLEVYTSPDAQRIYQRYTPNGYNGAHYYMRVYYAGTWYTWQRYSAYTPPSEAWIPVGSGGGSWTGGWSNYDTNYYNTAALRYEGTRVHMRGLIKAGSLGNAIWLPSGAAPLRDHIFTAIATNGVARVDVTQAGAGDAVSVMSYSAGGSNSYVSLDGIYWDRN